MTKENLVGETLKSFTFLSVLGAGSYAVVYEALEKQTQKRVAIKAIPISLIKSKKKLEELVKTELRVLKSCKSPNVIEYIDSFRSEKNIFIVTEFCNGGDVQLHLDKRQRFEEVEAVDFLKQILNGFKGLHEVKAMHRDFKLANLLLHNGSIKIADLGFAKQMETRDVTNTQLGTGLTMAPQILEGSSYGLEADIWSVGVVFYQMVYGRYPYIGHSDMEILKKIKKQEIYFPSEPKISIEAKDFIMQCMTVNPKERISWSEIYEHPLLTAKNRIIASSSISAVHLKDNLSYYQNNKQLLPEKEFMYPEKQQFVTEGFDIQEMKENELKKEDSDWEELKAKNEALKKNEQQIFEYEQNLLKKRNNIMFMFQFFIPKIVPFLSIPAIHNIAMFFICKGAYIEINSFIEELSEKREKKGVSLILRCFFESENCSKLLSLLKDDLEMITNQILSHAEDPSAKSEEIEAEMGDFGRWVHQNWEVMLKEVFDQYWFQLAERVNEEKNVGELIEILEALEFYTNNADVDVRVFEKMLETLEREECKEEINRKLFQSMVM